MSYREYVEGSHSFVVQQSPTESLRFNRTVLRGLLGQHSDLTDIELVGTVNDLDFDLMILRYPAARSQLFGRLVDGWRGRLLHADTLVYSTLEPRELLARPQMDRWTVHVGSPSDSDLQGILRRLFSGYTNHYSANPSLSSTDWLDGYLEWASTFDEEATNGERFTRVFRDRNDSRVGGILLSEYGSDYSEIVLGGVEEWTRGESLYLRMIAEVGWEMRSRDNPPCTIAVSTQVQNRTVQRSWTRLGMLPTLAYQTIHLMRS